MPDLRDQLDAVIPEPPPSHTWAADSEATARRRRHRTRAGIAALGGLAAATAVTFPALVTFNQPTEAVTVEAVEATGPTGRVGATGTVAAQASVPSCPAEVNVDAKQLSKLAEDPVAMRWCTTDGYVIRSGERLPLHTFPTYAPPDVLGADRARRWVVAYNALPKPGRNQSCTSDASIEMGALLVYANGQTAFIHGMDAGCRTIGGRIGFPQMRELALDLVAEQRASGNRPQASGAPCQFWMSLLRPSPEEIVAGALCEPTETSRRRARPLTSQQARTLANDLARHPVTGTATVETLGSSLQLYSSTGEFLTLEWSPSAKGWYSSGENGIVGPWQPSVASRAILDRLVKEK